LSTSLRAATHLPAGTWRTEHAADEILIDFDARFRRRFRLHTQAGRDILLDLPQAIRLRDGDGLNLEDGSILLIRARPEPLLEITAHDAPALMRIAWHLGNRHLPVQFAAGKIHIRADHVIADMIAGLGGHTRAIDAPFDPEAGAYAAGGHHHHDDDHDH
jgi:urease accessory protein